MNRPDKYSIFVDYFEAGWRLKASDNDPDVAQQKYTTWCNEVGGDARVMLVETLAVNDNVHTPVEMMPAS